MSKRPPIEVTHESQDKADALIAVYFSGASPYVSLTTMSLVTGTPLSDLYGAVRRHFKSIPRGQEPLKFCAYCKDEHLTQDFPRDKSRKDGMSPYCRTAWRLYKKNRKVAA